MIRMTLATIAALGLAFAVHADDSGSEDKKCDGKRCANKQAFLEKHDTDGDGKLSEAERQAFHAARKAEVLAKFDADGDGKLSDDERKAARAAFAKEHPRAGKGHFRKGKKRGDEPAA